MVAVKRVGAERLGGGNAWARELVLCEDEGKGQQCSDSMSQRRRWDPLRVDDNQIVLHNHLLHGRREVTRQSQEGLDRVEVRSGVDLVMHDENVDRGTERIGEEEEWQLGLKTCWGPHF